MACCGDREKGPPERKQRWEFIELNDFRCTSFWTYLAYGWLWFMGGVGVAVYAVDTFTAVNLLIFDRWSSQVQPAIAFKYSKWIFAACIFTSWALLLYEWIRALRVIQRDGVAASYMDPIAMSLQSMRSRGFKRFLVYTELTKSKKGTDYVAFFVYFAFQGAIRVILAEGPRQAVNAMTLYAVMQARIIDGGVTTNGNSEIQQFFVNIAAIASKDLEQAMIFGSMLFTLVIWVFSALCLIGAGVLYIVFLWHYIPQRDGRLRIYCRRKIDKRLEKIVAHWVEAAIENENRKREKAEKRAELKRQKTGELFPPPPVKPGISRAPTLPDLGDESAMAKKKDDGLSRQDTVSTVSTLPLYSSRPSTSQGMDRQPSLPNLQEDRPPMPSRTATQASAWSQTSFESNAPLLPNAGFAGGDGRMPSPAPTYYSRKPTPASSFNPAAPPGRMNTQSTQASQRSFTPTSATTPRPPPGQRFPVRSNTAYSFDDLPPQSATSDIVSPVDTVRTAHTPMGPPPARVNTADGYHPGPPRRKDSEVSYFSRPVAAPTPPPGAVPPPMDRRPTQESMHMPFRGPTPAPSAAGRRGTVDSVNPPFRGQTPAPLASPAYIPTPPPNSYEMISQGPPPSTNFNNGNFGGGAGPGGVEKKVYRPFNPALHTPNTPIYDGPRRDITVTAASGPDDYFAQHPAPPSQPLPVPQRSFTAPEADMRAMSSYGSILEDYGAVTPNEGMYGTQQQGVQQQQGFLPPRGPSRGPAPGAGEGRWQGY